MTRPSGLTLPLLLLLGLPISSLPACLVGGADDDDTTTDDDDATGDDDDATGDDDDTTGDDDDTTTAPVLPLAVTDVYSLTGYFSETPGDDLWTVESESSTPGTCSIRAGEGLGDCLRVLYNRDPDGNGIGPSFSGWFWQYPANNWGDDADEDGAPDIPGYAIPAGATKVTFWAWTNSTTAVELNFKAGIATADGFEVSSGTKTLSTSPTEYTVDLSTVIYTTVVGGFGMLVESSAAPLNNMPVTFYLDDITWE